MRKKERERKRVLSDQTYLEVSGITDSSTVPGRLYIYASSVSFSWVHSVIHTSCGIALVANDSGSKICKLKFWNVSFKKEETHVLEVEVEDDRLGKLKVDAIAF